MKGIFMSLSKIENLVLQSFDELYQQRLMKLTGITLSDLLREQNLYLLCATNGSSVSKMVEKLLEEYISSTDENIFGQTFMESIASIARGENTFPSEKSPVAYEAITLMSLICNNSTHDRKKYDKEWAMALTRFSYDFYNNFCNPDFSIDWEKLLRYNSGEENVPLVSKVIPVTVEDQEDESIDDEVGDVGYGNEDYE
jgi:Type II restriction endonuclease EcoO109I